MVNKAPEAFSGTPLSRSVKRSAPSSPDPALSRTASIVRQIEKRETGLNKRAMTQITGRELKAPRVSPLSGANRKYPNSRLPWLDGKTNTPTTSKTSLHSKGVRMPGGFVDDSDAASSGKSRKSSLHPSNDEPRELFYTADPNLHSTDSTRVVHQPAPRRFSTQSKSSLPGMPGRWQTWTTEGGPVYTPSVYSKNPPSEHSTHHAIPHLKRPASYEKLVDDPVDVGHSTHPVQPTVEEHHMPEPRARPGLKLDLSDINRPPSPLNATDAFIAGQMMYVPEPGRSSPIVIMPAFIQPSTDQLSPRTVKPRPVPLINSPEPASNAEGFKRAITGLENLMHEAVQVAKDAADHDNPAEASKVIDEARHALRKASTIDGMTKLSPLPISDSSSDSYSSSYSGSSRRSEESMMTRYTRPSQQPLISAPFTKSGRKPESEQAEVLDVHEPHHHRSEDSIARTPERFYHQPSVETIAVDWAYAPQNVKKKVSIESRPSSSSPNVRKRTSAPLKPEPVKAPQRTYTNSVIRNLPSKEDVAKHIKTHNEPPTLPRISSLKHRKTGLTDDEAHRERSPETLTKEVRRRQSLVSTGFTEADPVESSRRHRRRRREMGNTDLKGLSMHRRHYFSLRNDEKFSVSKSYKRQPIARNWSTLRKRITATIACLNTFLIGLIVGVYAGMVPAIQYQIADENHIAILGNVFLYVGLGLTTMIFWPLPLLHGRKRYTLIALAIAMPLQFPQAICADPNATPQDAKWRVGLLLSRAITGLILGFANINFISTLFDLFGASLQSERPHQELVIIDDPRRHGGGMGIWLGIWSWCWLGSISLGFLLGAGIIAALNPQWGFYIVVIILGVSVLINILAPETRRAPYRRTVAEVVDDKDNFYRRVAKGEVKLHISADGPMNWWEEVFAGLTLEARMIGQLGFSVLAVYIAWIYAEVVLIIVFLGALLSREYRWHPQYIGTAVSAVAIGALLAVPLSKANVLSRSRTTGPRTDSMTLQQRVTWTSHLVRRIVFTLLLPFAGLAYTLSSGGPHIHWSLPIVFAGLIGFLSNLAIAECHGLIMETFDTSDLQPGVNSRHRLQSMASSTRRRRTNYTSYPRITAGVFFAQGLAFFFAAAATGISGAATRRLGAQAATGCVAGMLLAITILLTLVLWRFKSVQVIPDQPFGSTRRGSRAWSTGTIAERGRGGPGSAQVYGEKGHGHAEGVEGEEDGYWKPVVIGNPSGKVRRMNILELGGLSRWTEIRRLNRLVREKVGRGDGRE